MFTPRIAQILAALGLLVVGFAYLGNVIDNGITNQTAQITAAIEAASQKQIEQNKEQISQIVRDEMIAVAPPGEGSFPFIEVGRGETYAYAEMTYTRLVQANGHTFGPGEFGVMKVLRRTDGYDFDGSIVPQGNTRSIRSNNPLVAQVIQKDWNRNCTLYGDCTQVQVTVQDSKIIDISVIGTIQPFRAN